MTKVIIEFPDEAAAKRFLGWMSDGGGEYQFMEGEDYHAPKGKNINKFDYKLAFPAWGYNPKKHGPDRVVSAVHIKG